MAGNSNQGFLNSLFQWTVKTTAEEAAAAAAASTTTSDAKPMNEEVSANSIKNLYYSLLF
jgi:hypothetical protein